MFAFILTGMIVEAMNRPAAFTGRIDSNNGAPDIVFEHITRFGEADIREAFVELPDIAQTESPIPLRIRVYPLDSDDLIAESYLAIVPFRARVSLKSSEQIIQTGDSVYIEIVEVQRGLALTRSPEGELVAYRENWENRYVHRKKGTPLSEAEYNELPDRSILSSAKTDYRLVERGKVREGAF